MTDKRSLAAIVAAGLLASLGAWSSAHAVAFTTPSTSNPQTFTNEQVSVTDTNSTAPSVTDNTYGTSAFNGFNASLGVLTGVTIELTSTTFSAAISGSGTGNGNAKGTGSGDLVLSAPGGSTTLANLTAEGSCAGKAGCAYGPVAGGSGSAGTTLSIGSSLNSYLGGTATVTRAPDNLTATSSGTMTPTTTTFTETWSGTLNTTYTYMLHGLPSFNSASSAVTTLDIDLGTRALGEGGGIFTLSGFSLFNPLHSNGAVTSTDSTNQVAIDLDSISGSGDIAKVFSSLVGSSLDLVGAGGSFGFTASLDTTTAGLFDATYTLFFSDANVGASDSRCGALGLTCSGFQLTLHIFGRVEGTEPPGVPAPPAGLLFALGIGLVAGGRLAWSRRRAR